VSFKELVDSGWFEILSETYAYSLSSLVSREEFERQVKRHSNKVEELFGVKPTTFRNTELIYSDEIGKTVSDMGYKLMLAEGAKHVLGWKSPNFLYCNNINPKLRLLLRNFRMSDDIAFRFSLQTWDEWPLTAEKYARWLKQVDKKEEVVNLFMDYETFGEHQWKETGIFDFLKALPGQVFKSTDFKFETPQQVAARLQPVSAVHVPYSTSWADEERDITAWRGNDLQEEAFEKLYAIEDKMKGCDDAELLREWNHLQASDHFYYMCTKWFSDGDVHKYFNPYPSPYEAFMNYMNILSDFLIRVDEYCYSSKKQAVTESTEKPAAKETAKRSSKNKAPTSQEQPAAKAAARKAEKGLKAGTTTNKETARKKPNKQKSAYTFDEIDFLPNTDIKRILKNIDVDTLAHALFEARGEVRDKIVKNLGKRASDKLNKMEENLKKVSKGDITINRKKIETEIRKLL
ncbi:MAG: polysaccharide deacetylase family protein, partial [Bacteroidales bacterium]|nr:polysaccharide deacetylase family protein [Bacteroidales bacterium]